MHSDFVCTDEACGPFCHKLWVGLVTHTGNNREMLMVLATSFANGLQLD